MLTPIEGVQPVAIALDVVEVGDDLKFSGVDLETGGRVTVLVERKTTATLQPTEPTHAARGLVLILSVQGINRS